MTGIDRLRDWVGTLRLSGLVWADHMADELESIAEQMKRETQPKRDPAADVSMSAYDALPPDERDAIAWVREHGGIEHVRQQWCYLRDRASHADHVDRQLSRRQRQIDESHAALRRRNERIAGLEHLLCKEMSDNLRGEAELYDFMRKHGGLDAVCEAVDFFEGMHDGLYTIDATERHTGDEMIREVFGWHSRRMPEGMEWPHYDTEELVDLGCEVARDDGMSAFVDKVVFTGDRWQLFDRYGCEINEEPMGPGERLTRPVRAISAEGEEIRADSDVWWICEGDGRGVHAERLHVESIGPTGLAECSPHNGGTWVHLEPSELYVNEPVPASDGRPLREGETVWDVDGHGPLTVRRLPVMRDASVILEKDGTFYYRWAGKLTHERPESKCRDCKYWQKDPTADNMGVCWFYYHEHEGQDCYAARLADIGACEEFMPRARALAGDA